MATAHITFGSAMGAGAPVFAPVPRAAQTITTSGTSQQTTISAEGSDYACVSVTGNVFIRIGANPTAASGTGYHVLSGTRMEFGPLKVGDKIAIIDAA